MKAVMSLMSHSRTIVIRIWVSVFAFTAFWHSNAFAHPHEFVDMKIRPQFSDGTKVIGIRYIWLFDEFFSAMAVQPADTDGDGVLEPEGLNKILDEILVNITPIDYFTKFDKDAQVPKIGKAKPISARMEKRQFRIEFFAPFEKPIDLTKGKMTYGIYDDEFYVAMHHSTDKDAVELDGAAKGCGFELIPPNPTEELQNFASSLGRDESGGTDLGYNFAEWVVLTCQ